MSEELVVARIIQHFGSEVFSEKPFIKKGKIFMRVDRECLRRLIEFLKNNGFKRLLAITGLETDEGVELLYHLGGGKALLNIRVKLPLNNVVAPSISDIFLGAVVYEREIYDMFGVKFQGDQNFKRLLLPDDWPNDVHPMRRTRFEKKGEAK
ncbi:MAG: NADH-quinone oxidoreductase subunit C [Candidatus Bathyarchaeia archaeon]